ncbi:E3 ubiquitin-protein ligase DCST1-like [Amphiura filiformis]|uniref:E3 ubiquitin-protein ligase DCST1-like n=1 Tax=Amphiura filiformis TaxID=82378 RepID=UPI003B2163F4
MGSSTCKSCLERRCPKFYHFIWSKHSEYRGLKFGLGVLFGAILGIALHFNVINKLNYPAEDRNLLGSVITLLIAFGFGISVQIRCIMVLVLPNFFGKNGRHLISSLAMLYLLTGPVQNIVANAQESSRSISCTAALTYNHSKEMFKLLHKPFTDAFNDMTVRGPLVHSLMRLIPAKQTPSKKLAANVRAQFQSFEEELSNDEGMPKHVKAKDAEKSYKDKMDFRCESVFEMAVQKCKDKFKETEKKCRKKIGLPLIKDLFCLPLKLTIVCNIVKGFDYACDAAPKSLGGLGEAYAAIEETFESFQENFKVSLKWKVTQLKGLLNRTSVAELQGAVLHEFHVRKQILDVFLSIAKGLVSFTFVLVFKSAHSYNSNYLRDMKFDNVYMTSYFRKIDARRKLQGKRTVLPLKKFEEKNDIIEPTRWSLRKPERSKLMKGTVRLFMNVIVSFVICAFDSLFFTMLDIIRRHTEIDFQFSGEHALRIAVQGDGAVAKLFRHLLRSFDNKHAINTVSTNRHCLPKPTKLDQDVIISIFCMWGAVWLLLYFQAYGLRLRRVICAFFYPKVEKARTLSLYNEGLRKRVGYLKLMRKKVRKLAKEKKLEEKADWTKCCGLCRKRTCLICEDPETKTFHHCQTEGCQFIYCKECWGDVKESCYACEPYYGSSDDEKSDSD